MTSRDGRWSLVFNGEIFNYLELRAELPGEFHSGTDTEVLLEGIAAWGVEAALGRDQHLLTGRNIADEFSVEVRQVRAAFAAASLEGMAVAAVLVLQQGRTLQL